MHEETQNPKKKYLACCFALTAAMISNGCSYSAPVYQDFCKNDNKKYSDIEKIEETLKFIINNVESPRMSFYKNSNFIKYYNKNNQKIEYVSKYLNENPDCCMVIRPPLYTTWYSNMKRNGFSDKEILGYPGEWVADVAIDKKSIHPESRARLWADFKVSRCNKVEIIPRG